MQRPANVWVILLFFVISIATTAVSNNTPSNNAEKAIKSLETTLERKFNQLIAVVNATSRRKPDNKHETPFSSCKEIYKNHKARGNRAYPLKMHSGKVFVYCHMTSHGLGACGGGGWTLVMKTDGHKPTFHFNSKLWSNKVDFNLPGGKTGFDSQETKLPTYWSTPFSKICLGMKIGHQIKFAVIYQHANSLYSLIADGNYRTTTRGRSNWKSLVGSQASLQPHCNKEGFNTVGSSGSNSKARIGIIGNEQNQCDSCDSRIGIGTGGNPDDSTTCGNVAMHGGDNGDQNIKAMGYILVQ